jgi:hypothetical protein
MSQTGCMPCYGTTEHFFPRRAAEQPFLREIGER